MQDAEKVLEIDNKTAEYFAYCAKINYLKGFYDVAVCYYTKALELQPETAEYYKNRGLAQISPQNAQIDFEYAIKLAPSDAITYHNLSLLLLQTNQIEKAKLLYENLLQLVPDHVAVLTQYGVILQQLNLHAEAITFFDCALLNDPNAADTLCNKAISQYKLGNIEAAKKDFIVAISMDEQNADIHYKYSAFLKKIRCQDLRKTNFEHRIS